MNPKETRAWVAERRGPLLWLGLAIAVSAALLLTQLAAATHGSSASEVALAKSSSNLAGVGQVPQYMPLRFLHWLTGWLPGSRLFWSRVPSVVFAGLSLVALGYIIKRWYGLRAAVLGFAVIVCSTWFLHVGRLGTTDVLLYWALPTLIASHLLLYAKPTWSRLVFWLVYQSVLLYVPGMIWFVLINIFWQRGEILEAWSTASAVLKRACLVLLPVIILLPLGYSLFRLGGNDQLLANFLVLIGMPQHWPGASALLSNLGDALSFIFCRGQASNDLWLNHLPILDIFLSVSLLVGLYFYIRRWRAFRSLMLLVLVVVSLLLITAGGPVTESLLVPLIYLVIPAGIAWALHFWVKRFPVNPLAKGFGIGLISLAVAVSSIYNLRSYFIAWPHTYTTQSTFTNHELPKSHL